MSAAEPGHSSRVCRIIVAGYALLALLSLLPLLTASDPLAGVFAILLAQPWPIVTGRWTSETSLVWNVALVVAGLVANAGLLLAACRLAARLRSP